MTRRGTLLSGSAWNLAGQALPLLVALVAIPWLIRLIGLDRFGFIALAWVLVGYAGVLDLGLGRALIRTLSARLAAGDEAGALASGRAGLSVLVLLGLVLAAAGALGAPWLLHGVLSVPQALQAEALLALYLLLASLPFVMMANGYVGVLSAHQAFKTLNLIRALFSTLSYLLPLLLALAGHVTLPVVVGTILVLRVLGAFAFAWACGREGGFTWRLARPERAVLKELLQLGGWMSVSNLVSPLLSYLDRLLLGALVPLRAVGVYSAPYDLVSKLMVLPYSIVAAWFPRASSVVPGSEQAVRALSDLSRWLYLCMLPPLFVMMALAHPAMHLWLGGEVGTTAAWVLQILVLGVFCNTLAQAPATLIQAAGQPRDMALLHLVELPLFLAVLWTLTQRHGIVGTAVAATLRSALDALAVFWLARRGVAPGARLSMRGLLALVLAAVALGTAALCRSTTAALATALLGTPALLAWGWLRLLLPAERQRLVQAVRGLNLLGGR